MLKKTFYTPFQMNSEYNVNNITEISFNLSIQIEIILDQDAKILKLSYRNLDNVIINETEYEKGYLADYVIISETEAHFIMRSSK